VDSWVGRTVEQLSVYQQVQGGMARGDMSVSRRVKVTMGSCSCAGSDGNMMVTVCVCGVVLT
jgi:hypothetical protein